MEKIKMTTPLVEMDGDEMTRILWKMIKDELILPFVDLKTEYYDLGLPNRDATADKVTMDAALANKKYGVSVKCATITPNAQRMDEYKLHEMWKSPNGTIRAVLDGTVFRAPIMIDSIQPVVKNWKKPITIARHAYGDVYKCTEFRIPGAGKAELLFTGADGTQQRHQRQKGDDDKYPAPAPVQDAPPVFLIISHPVRSFFWCVMHRFPLLVYHTGPGLQGAKRAKIHCRFRLKAPGGFVRCSVDVCKTSGKCLHPLLQMCYTGVKSNDREAFTMAFTPKLTYKGKPLVRKDNELYYGRMTDPYVLYLQILTTTPVGDQQVADKVHLMLLSTDTTKAPQERVMRQTTKIGLYNALDIGSIWLQKANAQ